MKYLLYTLVNFRSRYYLAIFEEFLKALIAFSDIQKFDFAIITDDLTLPSIKLIKELKHFPNIQFITVPVNASLDTALFRKFDITKHPNYLTYDKILFLDCDILVQENILNLFRAVDTKSDKLYVAEEGDIEGEYWYINALKNSNIAKMRKDNVKSFNSGTFLFKPSLTMKKHFEDAKAFGLTYKKPHFYDQPIFNYYFNIKRIAVISPYISKKLQMFPDTSKYYKNKMLMHISGIGRYKEKAPIMKTYLQFIKRCRSSE